MNDVQVVYLSGPMTGVKDYNRPLFNFYAAKLRRQGYEVINPAELDVAASKADLTWERCIMRDLKIIMETALKKKLAVATLPNWFNSRGAGIEVFTCATVKVPIMPVEELLRARRKHVARAGV